MRSIILLGAAFADSNASPVDPKFMNRLQDICNPNIRADRNSWTNFNMPAFTTSESNTMARDMQSWHSMPNSSFYDGLLFELRRKTPTLTASCTTGAQPCDADSLFRAYCTTDPQLVWLLASVFNYVRYLDNAKRILSEGSFIASGMLAGMPAVFSPSSKSTVPEDPTAKISAGLGILGAVAGLIPGIGSAASAAVSVGSSALQLFSESHEAKLDVRFDTWADLQTQFVTVVKATTKALDQQIADILQKPVPWLPLPNIAGPVGLPPVFPQTATGFETDPLRFPKTLATGVFNATSSLDVQGMKDGMERAFYTQAINHLWKKEKVVIAKVSKKSLGFDPCAANTPDIMFAPNVKVCDGGYMHLLQQMPPAPVDHSAGKAELFDDGAYKVAGFLDIAKYGLETSTIIRPAINRDRTKAFDAQSALDGIIRSPTATIPLVAFDMPICDLDKVTIPREYETYCTYGLKPKSDSEKNKCHFYLRLVTCGDKDLRNQDFGKDLNGKDIEWPWAKWQVPRH